MSKEELRKEYLARRRALTDADYDLLNNQLAATFFRVIDLGKIHVLHTFLPIRRNKEPDTARIIGRILKEFPDIRISVPRVNPQTGALENFFYEGPSQVAVNSWGIPEPRHGEPTPTQLIDLVLIPLLLFDLKGHRVGYGKGYYDRFIATCRKDIQRIGLSLFPPVESIGQAEDHDQVMDRVVTPRQEYVFR